MFARENTEVPKTRVVAQCRDADFERLVRSTFGMDGKVELSITSGAFAETVRKLDTGGATVVIADIDPATHLKDRIGLCQLIEVDQPVSFAQIDGEYLVQRTTRITMRVIAIYQPTHDRNGRIDFL